MSPPYPLYPLLRRDDHDTHNLTAPTNTTTPEPKESSHPEPVTGGGFPGFLIAVIVIGAIAGLAFLAFVVFRRRQAHARAFGSAPAAPSLDGARKGLAAFWYKLKNPRARESSAGFEGISAGSRQGGRAAPRGRALDPDEAWDSRVGAEADGYYDDTELTATGYRGSAVAGGFGASTEYVGSTGKGSGMPAANPFGDEHATIGSALKKPADNPFGDEHAAPTQLRSVSPRPVVDTQVTATLGEQGAAHTSPTRRSLFKENM